jgi:exopolyphosphatase/guanosine-5'-triphosphate,3'-diphosphate pyrophosphatase
MAKLEQSVWATEPVSFPVCVAALDIGSNAIRYTLAEFTGLEHYRELETQRFSVRLGHDAFTTGTLTPAALDAAVQSAVNFRQRLDDLGIARYRAVATSAVRESRNGAELVARVRKESGIHLETITGSEEARLVSAAVRKRVDLVGRLWLLADLGGGSIELSVVNDSGILASETHPLGTVRLLEEISGRSDDQKGFINLLQRYAARLALPTEPDEPIAGTIITGGNAEALADLIAARGGAPSNRNGTTTAEFTVKDLRAMRDQLAGLTVKDRIRKLALREDRADVILPAAIVFERVTRLSGSDRILVPRVGVEEGLLYDLVTDFAEHRAHEGELDRLAHSGALSLGRRYRFAEPHALHVRELALSLFDQLQWLHELGEVSRRRLSSAALLHDIGQFVSYRKHHKHSWYIIANSELPGLSPEDTQRVALITRYHRRSEPKESHEEFAELDSDGKEEVQKLAAILRVADALDREHQGHVKRVLATQKGGKIVLALETGDDTSLEHWAFSKKSPLFKRVYGLELVLD